MIARRAAREKPRSWRCGWENSGDILWKNERQL
jgi:hypothetical protein